MPSAMVQAVIFAVTVVFVAGGIVYGSRMDHASTKLDVNRMGGKIRDDERAAARRHHNLCMVIVANTDDRDTRLKIAGLLKED
jgi:hypothetical protein